jgi:hypothetical protein
MIPLLCVVAVCLTALAGTYMVLNHEERPRPGLSPEFLKGCIDELNITVNRLDAADKPHPSALLEVGKRLAKLEEAEAARENAKNLAKGLKL